MINLDFFVLVWYKGCNEFVVWGNAFTWKAMDTGGNTGQAAELYGFFVFTSKLLFRWLVSNSPSQLAAQAACDGYHLIEISSE